MRGLGGLIFDAGLIHGAGLQVAGDTLGAIVLDDDLFVGGEIVFDLEAVWQPDGGGRLELADAAEFFANHVFVTRADAKEEIRLAQEAQAEGLVVDSRRELVFPREDVGEPETGAFGLPLKEVQLFGEWSGGFLRPVRFKVGQQLTRLVAAEQKAGEEAVFYRE